MARWKLTNPATDEEYEWTINPSEEEEFGIEANIERSHTTAGGTILQQGADELTPLIATGTIFHEAQIQTLAGWKALCRSQTIYLTDHAGDVYEGTISLFKAKRRRTIRNPRDYANAPLWFWEYTFRFEPTRIVSGPWVEASP